MSLALTSGAAILTYSTADVRVGREGPPSAPIGANAIPPAPQANAGLLIFAFSQATPVNLIEMRFAIWPPNAIFTPPMVMSPTVNGFPPDVSPGGTAKIARRPCPSEPRVILKYAGVTAVPSGFLNPVRLIFRMYRPMGFLTVIENP